MRLARTCRRSGCNQPAVATLTFDYAEATAVLGPLATQATPQAYDLCADHAQSLSVPRGWQVVRLEVDYEPAPLAEDDLEALANAVRQASKSTGPRVPTVSAPPASLTAPAPAAALPSPTDDEITRRGHLRVLRGQGPSA